LNSRPFLFAELPLILLLGGAVFVPPPGQAQDFGEIKGLKLAEPYGAPHETQIKSLLEAAKARRLADGQYLCKEATLQTFTETGQRELVVRAPECVSDPSGHSANSAGPLKVQTADGKFSLEGEGFLWQQTNSSLIISNRVHTVIQPDLLEPSTKSPLTNAPATGQGIEIFSQQFEYAKNSGLGIYRDNVQVVGTNFGLASEKLTVELPMTERRLQSLTAEKDVSVDYTNVTGIHATAQRAVYSADTGLIHLTDHPTWRADRREGRGDELVIDRTNRIFQAIGNAWLKMPTEGKSNFGIFSTSNAPPSNPAAATNQFIEILADRYEIRTNAARFWEHVVVKQWAGEELRGKMSCVRMMATFSGSNELQNLVAETNVVIEDQDKRLTGGKAVYASTNAWLELTQNPRWKAGEREGRGELVRVNTQHEEMVVSGHAYLRLPANELGQSMSLEAPNAPRKPAVKSAGTQFGEIFCEDYSLTPALAVFRGGVHAKHPQGDWVCDQLKIRSLPANGRVLFADRGVTFTFINEKGEKLEGRGDHVVYTNNITPAFTNDIMYLRGSPARLVMTNTLIINTNIILDRASGTLSAPGGEYKITGTTKGPDTNMFKLPKKRTTP
jgi:lipopolysaccharide export system protein LptA